MSANKLHLYTSTGLLDFEPNKTATIIAELKDSNEKPISGMEIKWRYVADSPDATVTTYGGSSHTGADGRAEYESPVTKLTRLVLQQLLLVRMLKLFTLEWHLIMLRLLLWLILISRGSLIRL